MKSTVIGVVVAILVIGGGFYFFKFSDAFRPAEEVATTTPEVYECDADAKVCPDGSTVGRSGPQCAFAECPLPSATSATVTVSLGEKVSALGESITPLEVIEDSRCPIGVQCIWAGTVKVKVRLDTGMGAAFETLELGKFITTEVNIITLIEVSPAKNPDKELHPSTYRFTFEVTRRPN